MAIYLGKAPFHKNGDTFTIEPPTGFNSVEAVRITNYTVDALILRNLNGREQSVEYLMPFMQMVYRTANISSPPVMTGLQLGDDLPTELILVEWSTEAEIDFPGTYPVSVPIAPINPQVPSFDGTSGLLTIADGDTAAIPPDPSRIQTTFVNQGAGSVAYSYINDVPDPTADPSLVAGQGIAAPNGSAVFFTADGDTLVGWSGTIEV